MSCLVSCLTKFQLKDTRAHCYCASLVPTLFIRHALVTSYTSSVRTESKTTKYRTDDPCALTWRANIFVGCSVTPTFFGQITVFFWFFPSTKKQKKNWSVCGKFQLFLIYYSYRVELVHGYRCARLGSCIFLKANSTWFNDKWIKDLSKGLYMLC